MTRKMRAMFLNTLLKWKQAMEACQAADANYKAQAAPPRQSSSGGRGGVKLRDHGYRRSPDQPLKQSAARSTQQEEERHRARARERERERRHPNLASKVPTLVRVHSHLTWVSILTLSKILLLPQPAPTLTSIPTLTPTLSLQGAVNDQRAEALPAPHRPVGGDPMPQRRRQDRPPRGAAVGRYKASPDRGAAGGGLEL